MSTTTGRWGTPKASQYLQQLCKHIGHKVEARFDERAGTIAFPARPCSLSRPPLNCWSQWKAPPQRPRCAIAR